MHEEDAKDGEGSGMDHVDKALSGQDPRTRLFSFGVNVTPLLRQISAISICKFAKGSWCT